MDWNQLFSDINGDLHSCLALPCIDDEPRGHCGEQISPSSFPDLLMVCDKKVLF